MQGLGLAAEAAASPPPVGGHGRGARVAILGAGIAGLVLAYELERSGFDVVVLEARERVGGRNWTIRGGDRIIMDGEADQTAGFSKGLYFNAGPARIPSNHQGLLSYARRLGVPLEVEVNSSRSALLQSPSAFGGRPIQQRQAINDTRGAISELLAKATKRGALDAELSAEDKERLLAFLRNYGDLSPDFAFAGTERSGYATAPGAFDQVARKREALALRELIRDDVLPLALYDESVLMQATMFQPVGGMDQIPKAFARAIRSPIRQGADVTRIRHDARGVVVDYLQRRTGVRSSVAADYLVVTIPLPVLARIDSDFAVPVKAAIAGAVYDHAAKVAFESPRFWEAEQIYGGLSFVGGETNMVWYPSGGFQGARGTLVAAYSAGPPAKAFEARSVAQQIAMARDAVERLHPGHGSDLTVPVAVDWSKVPFNLGPWIHWEPDDAAQQGAYRLLNQPDGRVYFSGAHLSQLPSWQEGAIMAAHRTISELGRRVQADRLTKTTTKGPGGAG
jgi:monoamine oxidase